MPPLLLILLLAATLAGGAPNSGAQSFISATISQKGLVFIKDQLIDRALETLAPLRLPDIEKSTRIPFVGGVAMAVSNITLYSINVTDSTVVVGESGIVILASGATASLSLDWSYSYSSWWGPFRVSDQGGASIQADGMEVGVTMSIENQNGTLVLTANQCGCQMNDLFIQLDGGASWFYQGFINAFADQIKAAAETAITKKITEGTVKLDLLLQTAPKKIEVDKVAALNVTIVNGPSFGNATVELDVNGLFVSAEKVTASSSLLQTSEYFDSCGGASKMAWLALDEAVFNSASTVHFEAGLLHWMVDKLPEQSLLNTASWKFFIPQLYRKYPNDDMLLNISLTSPPVIHIISEGFEASVLFDMTVLVSHHGATIPVACFSVAVKGSGVVHISGNSLVGQAGLDDFTFNLKWSDIGNFHMYLIQGVIRAFLNTVFVPYVNAHLRQGFPLPSVHGFSLHEACIQTTSSVLFICSDVKFAGRNITLNNSFKTYDFR